MTLQLAGPHKGADAFGKGAAIKEKTEALTKPLSPIAEKLHNPSLMTSPDALDYLRRLDFHISSVGGMSDGSARRSRRTQQGGRRRRDPGGGPGGGCCAA